MHAFPKFGTNCSNNELVAPSPSQATEPSNIISTDTKADLFGERKHQIQNYLNPRKSENMVKQICTGKKKYQMQNYLNLQKSGSMVRSEIPQASGINKSKSTFGSPSKRKQNSKSNKDKQ